MRGLGRKTIVLRDAILTILADYSIPMSTRQIYYQLVSRGQVEANVSGQRSTFRQVLLMRREGLIPYGRIVDRTREKYQRPSWDGVQDILGAASRQYRRSYWAEQDTIPMIACEKQALEGIFSQAVDEFGASLWVLRGFNSESFEYDWAEEIRELNANGKRVRIFYFGDWDPSGLCIEETSKRKLSAWGADFAWTRAGLLPEDFDAFGLVLVPVKRETDSRAKAFLSRFGPRAAELDALPPDVLHRRIHAAIESCIDAEAWGRIQVVEQAERESLDLVIGNWDSAVEALRGAA